MGNGLQPNTFWYACMGALLGAVIAFSTQFQSEIQVLAGPFGTRENVSVLEQKSQAPAHIVELGITPIAVVTEQARQQNKEVVTVRRGNTLLGLLQSQGIKAAEAHAAVQSLSGTFDPRDIRVGQEIEVTLGNSSEPRFAVLDAFRIKVRPGYDVVVIRDTPDTFSAQFIEAETVREPQAFRGTIKTSLYEAAVDENVPPQVLIEMIRLFSYDVDFQRDIRSNDEFEIMFERLVTEDGVVVENSNIEYASMTLRGNTLKIFAYEHEDGALDYYNEAGKGIRKALMRTPINGARLSSSFGRRRHPVLGYTKMHRGVDFAAPRGTPVYAAGDGVIKMRQRWGSFGNYIRLRHGDGFSTAYAHMKSFKKGFKVGSRVQQGAIIGYVGTTGRSTGPHLHYEVLKNGGQVNPMKVRFPASKTLAGSVLDAFQSQRAGLDLKWARVTNSSELALLED